jgi:tetratricopeptide (TPR) repeat protein
MTYPPSRRLVLLLATLLSACGAAGPAEPSRSTLALPGGGGAPVSGVFGAYLSGRFAAAETDTHSAADRLLEALRLDPNQPELLQRAFLATVMDGRGEAQRLARRLPAENQLAALLLTTADLQAGRWDRAEQRLRALPRQGAAQILQPILLAWTQQGRGATDQALATLRPLAEGGRLRSLHALHAALIADLARRPRDAERWTRAALADSPDASLRLLQLSAGILARSGREAEAQRLLGQIGRGHGDLALTGLETTRGLASQRDIASPVEGAAEALLALAATLRAQGAAEPALLMARMALRLRPNFAPVVLLAADALADQRHPETSLALLETIRADDPLARVAMLRRASMLDRLDRVAEAEALLRQLAAEAPQAYQPLARLGDMLRARSRFPDAVTAYDDAIARLPGQTVDDWPLFYARGIAQERSGRWAQAEADFLRALELSPEQPYVLNYLAYTWVEQGKDLPRARAMLERAVELRPNDGNIVDSLGWALFRMGDLAGALRALERAVELEPRNSTVNDHLGDIYWVAGRQREAQFQWRRALGLEPEPDEAARLEAKLREGLRGLPAATAQR